MKRFLSIMLAAILVVACLAVTVFAADTATVSGSTDKTVAGGTASVTFSISEADFASYSMKISYDSSVLTLKSISKIGGSGMLDYSVETGKIAYAYSKNETVSGGLFTANFEVAATAQPGTYPVSISVTHVSEANLDGLSISAVDGAVVIECEHNYELIDSVEGTCIEEGYKTYKCSKCGHEYTEKFFGDHQIKTIWTFNKTHHWHECEVCHEKFDEAEHNMLQETIKPATKEEDGLKRHFCEFCDYEYEEILPKDLDDVPGTGDITPVIVLGTIALVAMMGASLFVFKRKAAK